MSKKITSEKKLDQNLLETIKIFNNKKIFYWICHGRLLGIIREKKLIDWDHDIDIAVWDYHNKKKIIIDLMLKKNFKMKDKAEDLLTFTKNGGREVDINFYHIKNKKFAYSAWYIPKNTFMKLLDALSQSKTYKGKFKFIINSLSVFDFVFKYLRQYFINKSKFYRKAGYTIPSSLLKSFKFINYQRLKLRVPKRSEECLKLIYGKNWKKPNKNYNWIKESPSINYY